MSRKKMAWLYQRCPRHGKPLILLWTICIVICIYSVKMSIKNAASPDSSIGNQERSVLYDKMAMDLDDRGAAFLDVGETSQSLSLSNMFTLKNGSVSPIHKAAIPPVRANVLFLNQKYSVQISGIVEQVFSPYFNHSIWFQNSSLFHFSLFHASHHLAPVSATRDEIDAEATAVRTVAESICPLSIFLDRIVLTSTGVLLGCWQVKTGTDPIMIRAKLRSALPNAPEKQLYSAAILHTSLARLLAPKTSLVDSSSHLQIFHKLVAQLNNKLSGFEAVVTELWYVEEYHVLALALNGRFKVQKFKLGCNRI